MINKNIQMKKKNGQSWDNLFPITLNENVFNTDGESLNDQLQNLNIMVDSEIERLDQKDEDLNNSISDLEEDLNEKTKHVINASELGIEDGSDLTNFEHKLNGLDDGTTIIFGKHDTYDLTNGIIIQKNLNIDFNHSTVRFNRDTSDTGTALSFNGVDKYTTTLQSDMDKGSEFITVQNGNNINVGDLIHITSNEPFNTSREYYVKGGIFKVTKKRGNDIALHRPIPFYLSTGATINVVEPTTVQVRNLNLINIGTLNRGTNGLQYVATTDSIAQNVTVDRFNSCFLVRNSVYTTYEFINPKKSYYEGTVESYGIVSYTTSGLNVRNSTLVSGRHGFSVSGLTPSFDTLIENCSIGTETDDGLAGLDFHDNNYNATIVSSTIHGARLAGNVTLLGCHFLRTSDLGKNIELARYDTSHHSNYIFNGCYFSEHTTIQVSGWRQDTTGTNSEIGQINITNCVAERLNVRLLTSGVTNDLKVGLLKISGTNNVSLNNLRGEVEMCVLSDMTHAIPTNLISTVDGESNIVNLVLQNIRITGHSGSIVRVTRFGRLLIDNIQVMGDTKSLHFISGGGATANCVIRHSHFNSVPNGIRFDGVGEVIVDGNIGFKNNDSSTVANLKESVYQ